MFGVKFNNVSIPSFVVVQAVDLPALGEVSTNIVSKTGGVGGILSGLTIGSKTIKLKVKIIPQTTGDTIPSMLRTLANWLRGNNWKTSVLQFMDDPNVVYDAVVNDGVDISDLIVAGEGEISFLVPAGVGRGIIHGDQATVDLENQTATLVYNGTAPSSAYIFYRPHYSVVPEDDWTMTVTETGDRLKITDFMGFTETTIDCETRRIVSTGITNMQKVLVNYSEWINFPHQGTFHITWNFDPDCELTISTTEYYF